MNPEILFLRTLEDMENKLSSRDAYELLGLAALLRKLLFDENSLLDVANRPYRQKITFVVGNDRAPEPKRLTTGSFWSQQDSLDPNTAPPHITPIALSRRNFANKVILVTKDNEHTIKEVIRYVAHVVGAVHVGKPKGNKEAELQKLDQLNNLGGHSMVVRQLMSISRVVLNSLKPVRDCILADVN